MPAEMLLLEKFERLFLPFLPENTVGNSSIYTSVLELKIIYEKQAFL